MIRLRPNNISIRDSFTTTLGYEFFFIPLIIDNYSARDLETTLSYLEYT